MSYCRHGWDGSDLYLFQHVDGYICCSACRFDDPWIVELHSLGDALDHIHKHQEAGHNVPVGLMLDIAQDNPWSNIN